MQSKSKKIYNSSSVSLIIGVILSLASDISPKNRNYPKEIATYRSLQPYQKRSTVKKDIMNLSAGLFCLAVAGYLAVCTQEQFNIYKELKNQEINKSEIFTTSPSFLVTLSSKIFTSKAESNDSKIAYQQLAENKRIGMLDSSGKAIVLGCLTTALAVLGSYRVIKIFDKKSNFTSKR